MNKLHLTLIIMICLLSLFISCSSSGSSDSYVETVAYVGGSPDGITVTSAGNLYVTDVVSGDIIRIDESGDVNTVSTGVFTEPDGIVSFASGTDEILYIADTSTGDIGQLTVDSSGTVTAVDSSFVSDISITNPTGLALDSEGNIYAADQATGSIYKIPVVSGAAEAPVEITGLDAVLSSPHGLAADITSSNSVILYTTDQTDNNVVKINISDISDVSNTSNITVSEIGIDSTGGYEDGGPGSAKFKNPHGIAVRTDGSVMVSDEENNRIRLITPSGNVITFAGDGTAGDRDGDADSARINNPRGAAVSNDDTVYICDYTNGKVKKIR